LSYMQQVGATDDADLSLGLGIMRRFEKRGVDYAWGHTGRDLGYAADLFYFPNKNVSIAWCINYGADADSYLKPVILDFQKDLIDLMLK
jgi:D-alanyl-D-alanine carboxypeptidase